MYRLCLDALKSRPRISIFKILTVITTALFLSACAPKAERQFKQGCRDSGLSSKACSCVYKKLEQHYGADNWLKFAEMKQLPPEDYAETAFNYTLQCGSQYP
jgi:hypothetical protein